MLFQSSIVFVATLFVATQINRAIYGLALRRRSLSPWARGQVHRRSWHARIPVFGWWSLRREQDLYGDGQWVRPMLLELAFASGITALYVFETTGGLLPIGAMPVASGVLHVQFLSHAVLLSCLTIATFIDLDEQIIPDQITVPGTVVGLLLAGVFPQSLLPAWQPALPPLQTEPLVLTMPRPWTSDLDGPVGLAIALACLTIWWYALLPKTLYVRGGWQRFARYLIASIRRHPTTPRLTALALAMAAGVLACWWMPGADAAWPALLSSLVGMTSALAFVWSVRVVASGVLGQEALGFGDVTLMGMIGTFVGWQSSVIVFFMAPFAGVVVAVLQWLFTGRKDIAYGPFLCLATCLLIVFWPVLWRDWGLPIFSLGWFIPVVLFLCIALLGALLTAIQVLKRLLAS